MAFGKVLYLKFITKPILGIFFTNLDLFKYSKEKKRERFARIMISYLLLASSVLTGT